MSLEIVIDFIWPKALGGNIYIYKRFWTKSEGSILKKNIMFKIEMCYN